MLEDFVHKCLTARLVSPYGFISIDTASKNLSLIPLSTDEIGVYEGSYIEFVLESEGLKVRAEILAEVQGCNIDLLSFSKDVVDLEYAIGADMIEYDLPDLVETPDCGTSGTWEPSLKSIDSNLAYEQALTVVMFDAASRKVTI